MHRNYFYVVALNRNTDIEKGRCAYAEKVSEGYNLQAAFPSDAECVLPCSTYKRAKEIADSWNESYMRNGTYITFPESEKGAS